ncbi:primase C-terminal domain-containing protein [Macrococcus bovicus]|uniref:primase C-terminal domain-containing protein n=1 Tax=Macrococcus bovicus TaxID=69968 RepID=UPI0025A678E4|nr:primase C-terminal domain-containing protein [Macrococcus bovicus]WJP96708.1 primase C-terminal domain-containing protein [Macrococcus bovicus]
MYTTQYDMQEILDAMMNGGLRGTKYKGSKAEVADEGQQLYPGKVFGTRSKKELCNQKGIIFGSMEALTESHHILTHITPNVYRSAKRTMDGKTKGHSESNLKQINVFAIDIDGINKQDITMGDIMLRGHEVGLVPTLILDTPNGYHVMFFLKEPIYIKRTEARRRNVALDMAKRISINLRRYFGEIIPGIDVTCNHFGYFRCPTQDNIIDYRPGNQYTVAQLIDFSRNYEEYHNETGEKSNVVAIRRVQSIHDEWFHRLYNCKHIKGSNGQIGRDNAIFTMALHCYASGMEKAECLAVMQNFNSNLEEPLSAQTVDLKVESAYSGEYYGASNRHINALMYAWCEITDSRRNTFWFQKHAKKREDRERSHYMEWERDLYLYVNKRAEEGYLVTTTAQIMEDLGIARSSLYGLLKITNNVFWSATKGRNARVTLYTRKTLFQHALNCVRKFNVKKTEYKLYIETLLPEANRAITDAITAVLESFQENDENTRYKAVSEINTS